jgi:hypothetical protein
LNHTQGYKASEKSRVGFPTYRECAEAKDTAENCFSLYGQLRLQEDRHRDEYDHDVGRDVEHGIGDQVVRGGGALG